VDFGVEKIGYCKDNHDPGKAPRSGSASRLRANRKIVKYLE